MSLPSWILLSGGAGLEAQYLMDLATSIPLKGQIVPFNLPRRWVDSPSDYWTEKLFEFAQQQSNPVLLAHSFGGMLALSEPKLISLLRGAVIFDSSPSRQWEDHVTQALRDSESEDEREAYLAYDADPSDETFKQIWFTWLHYYFHEDYREAGKRLFERNGFNHIAWKQALDEFLPEYENQWREWTFPTLIVSGKNDRLTPLSLFHDDLIFQSKSNVKFYEVPKAGHFPWVENFAAVQDILLQFQNQIA